MLDLHFMDGVSDWWGWAWLGIWRQTEGQSFTTDEQLALEGYANVLDQDANTFDLILNWKDADGTRVDLDGDGVYGDMDGDGRADDNEDDRTVIPISLAGNGTWEHIDMLITVPAPLGVGTIAQATVGVFNGYALPDSVPWRLGVDQLSLSVVSSDDADFDGDGDVDGDDFLAWQTGFGTQAGAQKSDGDYDNDGDVDGDDFLGWQSEFGSGSGAASTAVPEPSSLALALFMAAVGAAFRRSGFGRQMR